MKAGMVRMGVRGVAMDGRDSSPVIILGEEGGQGILAVPAGPFEASSVIIRLEGITPPRPLTHDILASLFEGHGLSLDRVELYGALEDSYLCRMRYRIGPFRRRAMEIRPSDGISLAVRTGTPLYADSALFGFAPANRYVAAAECPGPRDVGEPEEIYFLESGWAAQRGL
jgi:uncharacterized protein